MFARRLFLSTGCGFVKPSALISVAKRSLSSIVNAPLIQPAVEVEEIEINVPWGHLAGKWWGPKNVRPILSLHGWQDNAGTFDTIIPLLPKHLSYLAIDLPGHGLSSRIPDGIFYSTAHALHCMNIVRRHYDWDKLSLMAHSMSSIISFQYASIFPDNCDLVIALDTLKPIQAKPTRIMELLAKLGNEFNTIDERNRGNLPPPSYTYDDIVERWVKATNSSVTQETAPLLMKRSIAATHDDPPRYYFTRDSRLKVFNFAMISHELCLEMAKRIKIPYILFKGSKSPYYENKQYFDEVVRTLKEHNTLFEWHLVEGTHHFHLTQPTLIAAKLSEFVNKYRPS